MNIKYLPLTKCLEKIIDNRGKTVPTTENGIPLIATNCIKENELYPVFENIRYITEDTYKNWFRDYLQPNDILFVNKGTPGKVALCPNPLTFVIAQDAIGLRANNDIVYWKYLYYYLKSEIVQNTIKNNNVGLIIPHFKKSFLDRILIPIIPMKEQKKIGDLLYSIDEQIVRNNNMVQKLQVLGQTIYSRNIKETKDFFKFDVSKITTGKQDANFATKNGQYKFFTCSEDSFLCDNYEFDGKNILIAGNGNFNVKFYDGKFNAYQRTYIIKDEEIFGNLYYTYSYNTQLFLKGSNGSIVKFITIGMIKDIDIPKFSDEINKTLNNIILEISAIKQSNEKLNNLKQTLLPLLINGQLEI